MPGHLLPWGYSGRKPMLNPAALVSLIVGSGLRLLMFFIIPPELAGLDTMIPPPIAFALFVIVALATQKRHQE